MMKKAYAFLIFISELSLRLFYENYYVRFIYDVHNAKTIRGGILKKLNRASIQTNYFSSDAL